MKHDETFMFVEPALGVKVLEVSTRYFTVEGNEVLNTLALSSPVYKGAVWWARDNTDSVEYRPTGSVEAVCRHRQASVWKPHQMAEYNEPHPVPNAECDCGLWAYHEIWQINREPRATDIVSKRLDDPYFLTSHIGSVLAAVYAWGEGTLTNELTLRSKHMRVAALCSYSQVDRDDLEEIAAGLDVPLLDRDEFEEYYATIEAIRLMDFTGDIEEC